MAGKRSLKTSSVSQLTLPPETIASCYRRSRHQIPTAFRTVPGSLFQLATFEDQHTGPGVEELASNRQTGRTAANYDNVCINYGIRTDRAEIVDLHTQFSESPMYAIA